MPLEELPTEITQQIVVEAIPDGFEGIALTCKSLFSACQAFVEGYNKKKRRFNIFAYSRHSSDIECDTPGDKSTCTLLQHWDHDTAVTGYIVPNVFALLNLVSRDSTIGRFVNSLDLKHDDVLLPAGGNFNMHGMGGPSPAWSNQDKKNIRNLLSGPLFTWGLREDAATFNLDLMTVLEAEIWLLASLSHVTDIALSKAWAYYIPTSRMAQLESIVQRANDPTKIDAALSRLTIMKPFVGHGWDSVAPLFQLVPFLSLNSLEEFYMGGMKALEYSPQLQWFNVHHFSPSLTKIELNGSCIGAVELSQLLSGTPNLKCLYMNLETKPNGSGRSNDIGRLLAIISLRVGGVLEDLAISNNAISHNTTTLRSMDGFTRLKNLELEFHMLWGTAFRDTVLLRNPEAPATLVVCGLVPSLVDLLPPNIETFTIYSKQIARELRFRPEDLTSLLHGFPEQRHSKLPRLTDITLVCPYPGDLPETSEIMVTLRILTSAGLAVHHSPGNSCVPLFSTTFNSRFNVGDAIEDRRD